VAPGLSVFADNLFRVRSAADEASERDQDTCPDKTRDQVSEPAGQRLDIEDSENPVGDDRAYDAKYYVHDHAHIAVHELLRQPSGETADNDGCNPTYTFVFHGKLPPGKNEGLNARNRKKFRQGSDLAMSGEKQDDGCGKGASGDPQYQATNPFAAARKECFSMKMRGRKKDQ
jgi:hypothetical protein